MLVSLTLFLGSSKLKASSMHDCRILVEQNKKYDETTGLQWTLQCREIINTDLSNIVFNERDNCVVENGVRECSISLADI